MERRPSNVAIGMTEEYDRESYLLSTVDVRVSEFWTE